MPYRRIAALLVVFCSALAAADIVEDVRTSLAHQNPAAAESQLNIYKLEHGTTSEYIEALSWMARSALAAKQFDKAETDAKETESLVRQQLAHSKVDTDQHLATALGAAIEVQAQVLAARGQQAQAVALLRRNIATYTKTSIQPRLQKNLNLLALVGQPAPPLSLSEYFGPKPVALAQLKGSPVLLFFWAHWCPDCKIEGPIIAQLLSEFGPKGLVAVAPTQLYGYAAHGEDATPKDELAYIQRVWQTYYQALQNCPVPVSQANFNLYGASTTPTLVLLDRAGKVSLYHPGAMPSADLRVAIEKIVAN
jgi:thiol-disulfide isomerase/thioredoxin